MFDEHRRPWGRLFYLLASVMVLLTGSWAQTPSTTMINEVQYWGLGRALARVTDPARIAVQQNGSDDGVRGLVRRVQAPSPRTSADCENAALALLDDASGTAWAGEYTTWNDGTVLCLNASTWAKPTQP